MKIDNRLIPLRFVRSVKILYLYTKLTGMLHLKMFSLIIFFIPLFLTAQYPWDRVTPLPQEHNLFSVKKIPGSGKIIAVGSGTTVMISPDFGDTWEFILNPSGLPNNTHLREVEFIDQNIGYIVGLKGIILKTSNGGYDWDLVHYTGEDNDEFRDVCLSDTNNAFAIGIGDLIIRTFDGGVTWDTLDTEAGFTFFDIDFLNSDTGFIVGSSGFEYLRTIDGGYNWEILPLGIEQSGVTCYEICFPSSSLGIITTTTDNNNGKFFRSTDGGDTWEEVFWFWNLWPHGLDYLDDNIIIASGFSIDGSLLAICSYDSGETWTLNFLPWEGSHGARAVCCDKNSSAIIVGSRGQIHRTDNYGVDWELISTHMLYGSVTDVDFVNKNTGFLLTYDAFGVPSTSAYKTTNGGNTWLAITSPFAPPNVISFIDEQTGYLAHYNWEDWFLKTTNGGSSWVVIGNNLNMYDEYDIYCLRFHDNLMGILSLESGIYQTLTGGQEWTQKQYGEFEDLAIENWPVCFAAGWSRVYRSNDGGSTWNKIESLNSYRFYDIFVLNNDTIFLAGYDKAIVRSKDGGNTWEQLPVNTPHDITFKSIAFSTPELGIAVGAGNYETMVYTDDGGDSWHPYPSITTSTITHIEYLDELTGLMFGGSVILKTEDGGITWTNNTTDKQQLEIYPNPFQETISILIHDNTSTDITLEIYSINGQRVFRKTVDINSLRNIKVGFLPSGIYLIQVTINGINYVAKAVK